MTSIEEVPWLLGDFLGQFASYILYIFQYLYFWNKWKSSRTIKLRHKRTNLTSNRFPPAINISYHHNIDVQICASVPFFSLCLYESELQATSGVSGVHLLQLVAIPCGHFVEMSFFFLHHNYSIFHFMGLAFFAIICLCYMYL